MFYLSPGYIVRPYLWEEEEEEEEEEGEEEEEEEEQQQQQQQQWGRDDNNNNNNKIIPTKKKPSKQKQKTTPNPGLVVLACNPSIQEVEAGRLGSQGQLCLCYICLHIEILRHRGSTLIPSLRDSFSRQAMCVSPPIPRSFWICHLKMKIWWQITPVLNASITQITKGHLFHREEKRNSSRLITHMDYVLG